jgi:hypothetical protein
MPAEILIENLLGSHFAVVDLWAQTPHKRS